MQAIRPTRDGWWAVVVAVGLGVAAVNTGNNLAYLLCSMLLGLIMVSGMLSDVSMRGLALTATAPDEVYAGRAALVTVTLRNRKRRFASYSLALEAVDAGKPRRLAYTAQLPPGAERLVPWDVTLPARGRHPLPGVRVATRFPFGLFVKASPTRGRDEVIVYPAVGPLSRARLAELAGDGDVPGRRRGRGEDLRNLRPYQAGDEPRLVHWRLSAKNGVLTVRELEADTALDTRLVLTGTGARDATRLERGLAEAASLAVHLLRAGAGVELVGPGVHVPADRGRDQERRILTALALYAPRSAAGEGPAPRARATGRLRELRVSLD
jgi:uncharacterized protein (DUF58 family)